MRAHVMLDDRRCWVSLTGQELLEKYGAHLATYRSARRAFELVLEASYMTRQLELMREVEDEQAQLAVQRKEAKAEFDAEMALYRARRVQYILTAVDVRIQEHRKLWYRAFFTKSQVIRELKEVRDDARRMFNGTGFKPKLRPVRARPKQVGLAQAVVIHQLQSYRWKNGEELPPYPFPPYNGGVHTAELPKVLPDEVEELFLTAAKDPERNLSVHVDLWNAVDQLLARAVYHHHWINETLPRIPPAILLVVQDPDYTAVHDMDRRILERFFAEEPKDMRNDIGFIAQEVRSVAPELVRRYPPGNSHKAG